MVDEPPAECKPPPVTTPLKVSVGLPCGLNEYAEALARVDAIRRELLVAENSLPVASAERRRAEAEFERAAADLAVAKENLAAGAVTGLRLAGELLPALLDSALKQTTTLRRIIRVLRRRDRDQREAIKLLTGRIRRLEAAARQGVA